MIDVLGIKRIVILVMLVAVNGFLVFLLTNVLAPQKQVQETELRGVRGQLATVTKDLNDIQVEFSLLEEQRENFQKLEAKRFFEQQDRRRAQELLEAIQDRSRVLSAKAMIGSGDLQDNYEATRAAHKILSSPLEIEIAAMDDTDVIRYLWLLEHKFPGYIDVQTLSIERLKTVDRELLQSITAGQTPEIVKAKMTANWKTMIPDANANITGNPVRGGR